MTLAAPPALNQRAQPDADAAELCGETSLSAILQALGFQVTPEDVVSYLRSIGGEPSVSGGTAGSQLMAAAQHFGASVTWVAGDDVAAMRECWALSRYALILIADDLNANPVPVGTPGSLGHWIDAYAELGGSLDSVACMNPWGLTDTGPGRLVAYPMAQLASSVQEVIGVWGSPPKPPALTGGTDVSAFAYRPGTTEKHIVVRGTDGACWHGWGADLAHPNWESLGGKFSGQPSIEWAPDSSECVIVGPGFPSSPSDVHAHPLYFNRWDGTRWEGWIEIPQSDVGE